MAIFVWKHEKTGENTKSENQWMLGSQSDGPFHDADNETTKYFFGLPKM